MKYLSCLVALTCLVQNLSAQDVYTIKADSVKLTGCDSSELIIENHTQAVKGFLYNTGNGRTIFKKGIVKVNDSVYIIGGDTLKYNAWVQGGNRWGTTGILGTLDANHLDFYTNGMKRMRLTNTGDLNIGSATVTSDGRLIATNAILFDHFIPRFHNNSQSSPYVARLEDVLYNYSSRLQFTTNLAGDGTRTIDIVFPPDEAPTGITYPQGRIFFSFWSTAMPQSISVMVKDYYNNWHGPFVTSTNLNSGAGLFCVNVPGNFNYLTEIQAVLTPTPGVTIATMNMEYVLDVDQEGLTNPHPYVSKYMDEHIYNYFYLKNGGVDNVRLSPFLNAPNYFMNGVGIGTSSPTAQLHTTAGVRFAGLTNSDAQTRILVSDADGNLYYRNASSLTMGDIPGSSLAVNGPVRARSLTLSQTGWPDYVFDSAYRLMPLKEVEGYIRVHNHLPDVPSAASVEKDGLSVGETQAALLKKIEELTLYNIDGEKKNDELRQMLKEQAQLIEMLQKRVSKLESKDHTHGN